MLITLLFIQSKKEYEKYELNFKPRTTIINGEGVPIKYDNYTNYIPLKESGLVTEVNKTNTEVEYKLKEGIEYIKDKKVKASEVIDKDTSSYTTYMKMVNVSVPQIHRSYYIFYQKYDIINNKEIEIVKNSVNSTKYKETKLGEVSYTIVSYLIDKKTNKFFILQERDEVE